MVNRCPTILHAIVGNIFTDRAATFAVCPQATDDLAVDGAAISSPDPVALASNEMYAAT